MPIEHDKHGDPLARHSLSPIELKELLEAERAGRPFVVFRDDEGRLRIIPTGGLGQTLTLGRAAGMDLSISWDAEVSALHAELHGLGGESTIVDDGLSTNGTFVNGQRIRGRVRLRDGDRIRVGHTTIAYRAGRASVTRTTKSAPHWTLQPLTDTQRRVLVALCRPFRDGANFATPATNQQIAAELFLSVDAVKMHLRTLFAKFGLAELPQNEKRARLVESAMQSGAVSQADLR